jgi:adenylate kinase
MRKEIIFVGGIHGVGKGTFCRKISDSFQVEWFSASDLLKWSEISTKENKKVADFDETQQRLLQPTFPTL